MVDLILSRILLSDVVFYTAMMILFQTFNKLLLEFAMCINYCFCTSMDAVYTLPTFYSRDLGIASDASEESLITEKLARIFVELAKRTWPLQWTDMDSQLRSLYEKNELSTALMSVTVGSRILNTMLSKPVEAELPGSSNRQDLQLLMQLVLANPENEGWLMRWSLALEPLATSIISKSDEGIQCHAESFLTITLNCLVVFLDWASLDSIEDTRILSRLLQLYVVPSSAVRIATADCLTVLFSRNIRPLDPVRMSCLWQPLFVEGQLNLLTDAWTRVYNQYSTLDIEKAQESVYIPDQDYVYLKRLAHAITALGDHQICFKRNTTCPQRFDEYMQLVLLMTAHPSLIVSGYAVSFLLEAIKHEYMRTRSNMANKSSPVYRYAVIDFDSSTEIEQACLGSIQRIIDVARLLSPIHPYNVFGWLQDKCFSMLSSPNISPSECYAIATMTDCIIGSLPPIAVRGSDANQQDLTKNMMSLLVRLIDYDGNQDSAIVVYQLQMIVAFSDFMDLYPEILPKCLEKFFSFVVFTQASENHFIQNHTPISENTRNVRRKAAASLVRIGSAMPNLLQPLLDQIMPVVSNYIQTNQLLRIEQTLLIEFIVAIICGSSMPAEIKCTTFQNLLSWDLEHFRSTEIYVGSTEQFFEAIGVSVLVRHERALKATKSPGEDLHDVLAAATSLRNMWSSSVNAIWNYLKRARQSRFQLALDNSDAMAAPVPNVWPEIPLHVVPHCLATIKRIHQSWSPEVLSSLPPDFMQFTRLTRFERALLLGEHISEKEGEDTSVLDPESSFEGHLKRICGWLGRTREICLMRPFMLNCPSEVMTSVLLPILPTFFELVVSKLAALWRDHPVAAGDPASDTFTEQLPHIRHLGEGDDCDDDDDVSEEIIADKLLRDVTRVYADLWFGILVPFAEKNPRRKIGIDSTTLSQQGVLGAPDESMKLTFQHHDLVMFIFSNETLIRSFLGTISLLMSVKDTFSCKRAISICVTLLPHLVKDPIFHEIVGRDFLVSALEVLHDGYQRSNHAGAVALIGEVYTGLRGLSRIPFDTLASIPGMTLPALQSFEDEWASKATVKERNIVVRDMLKSVTGVELSERYKKAASFVLNISEKGMFAAAPSDSHHADVIEKETIAPVLSSFFESHD
ncbi:hypothetical protein BSLG_006189 [Batrachochytrium salamandrivorans]|nr:hypothetical protein BSLG_006189 [Batrachochytrium salamandrivorans]